MSPLMTSKVILYLMNNLRLYSFINHKSLLNQKRICKRPIFLKLFKNINIIKKYDLKGNTRSYKTTFMQKIILALSFMDRFWWKFWWMLISCTHNYFNKCIWPEISLLCSREVLCFFTLWPSDPITTLTYVLMYNFCPFFLQFWK